MGVDKTLNAGSLGPRPWVGYVQEIHLCIYRYMFYNIIQCIQREFRNLPPNMMPLFSVLSSQAELSAASGALFKACPLLAIICYTCTYKYIYNMLHIVCIVHSLRCIIQSLPTALAIICYAAAPDAFLPRSHGGRRLCRE